MLLHQLDRASDIREKGRGRLTVSGKARSSEPPAPFAQFASSRSRQLLMGGRRDACLAEALGKAVDVGLMAERQASHVFSDLYCICDSPTSAGTRRVSH
jgi:hypothetical protein